MKAAVITTAGQPPVYADAPEPSPKAGELLLRVQASALSQLAKGRAAGTHYSADNVLGTIAGVDGVGLTDDGRRVYFALPDAPNGAMAERTAVPASRIIELPEEIDTIEAAAIANPGMSVRTALVLRANFQPGETVLINGATGAAGKLCVQVARHLGAGRILVSGRNAAALEELRALGADIVVPFSIDASNEGSQAFEDALKPHVAEGIDVVIDYLWGASAQTILTTIAKAAESTSPVRFVQVGSMSGGNIQLPSAALRSSPLVLMGSGLKSVPLDRLLDSVSNIFRIYKAAGLQVSTKTVPLTNVSTTWLQDSRERIVFTTQS
ncbi:MAG: zinc-binding alcohol dehydrogenase family protein [Acidobacteriaceae bacterium]|nr:zinc-binding alcohol dehydrogenase family protein [Acidobacteriaceae bacterium]